MGDRNNPIKFGPEWLRNLSHERAAPQGNNGNRGNQGSATSKPPGFKPPGTSASGPNYSTGSNGEGFNVGSSWGQPTSLATNSMNQVYTTVSNPNNYTNMQSPQSSKIYLAKLRYGREEMLALYDRSVVAPAAIKNFDVLYNPRPKPPIALNNNFEDDMRENLRIGPSASGNQSTIDRFGSSSRGLTSPEGRAKVRMPFVRYSYTTSKWQGNTNWRKTGVSPGREESEEWRGGVDKRTRADRPDKWERDWGDRNREKPKWDQNRSMKPWSGDGQTGEDNLPEWAEDNAEACGGTFDSSGAFHGYSSDDSNLPKTQVENAYALTRSHTHGNFTRQKSHEEGSDEWWASEKAKKLSPKRFDATEVKFKKPNTVPTSEPSSTTPGFEEPPQDTAHKDTATNNSDNDKRCPKKNVHFKSELVESRTFDALRSEVTANESNDERGDFKSVMINPNNSLRQKHQNIVSNANETTSTTSNVVTATATSESGSTKLPYPESSPSGTTQPQPARDDIQIINDIIDLTMNDKNVTSMPLPIDSRATTANVYSKAVLSMPSVSSSIASPMYQSMMSNPSMANQGGPKQSIPSSYMQTPSVQSSQNNSIQSKHHLNSSSLAMSSIEQGTSALSMASTSSLSANQQYIALRTPHVVSTPGVTNTGMPVASFASSTNAMPKVSFGNNSLFLSRSANVLPPTTDYHKLPDEMMSKASNILPMHNLHQQSTIGTSPSDMGSNMYSFLNQPPPSPLNDQWYYEDPTKNIQGPFTSKEMYNWYQAGFFTAHLMVRRANDLHMRPLGSYGPVVPFSLDYHQLNPSPFNLGSGFDTQQHNMPHDSILNSKSGIAINEVMHLNKMPESNVDQLQYNSVRNNYMNPTYGQQQTMVNSLWSQPATATDDWIQQSTGGARKEHDLHRFLWEQQKSGIPTSMLPESFTKEMKTEDQILAQLRASQKVIQEPPPTPSSISSVNKRNDTNIAMAPGLGELEKLLPNSSNNKMKQTKPATQANTQTAVDIIQGKPVEESSPGPSEVAQAKSGDTEKASKSKDAKKKKSKEDKKDESIDTKKEELKREKNVQSSPVKKQKEDKLSKKESELEKKEWIKEGFTIVKGPEKPNKEIKKKLEEAKAAEEMERKRKEEERLVFEEERRKQVEAQRKQQEQVTHRSNVSRKAPWSVAGLNSQPQNVEGGLTLAEIQKLEREKKLEQMKEQQQMMKLITQQQQAQLAREQEMQASLGWAKKKANNYGNTSMTLAEIQAEARQQALAAASLVTQVVEEIAPPTPAAIATPWGGPQNGGLWGTTTERVKSAPTPAPVKQVEKPAEPKPVEKKPKKKAAQAQAAAQALAKKDNTPTHEFENWCSTALASWSSKIDVPTFIGFLKDIESPYEVKDYVRCYLGDSKDSNDFARQFLERRSKLLRAVTATPVDDLCSPAAAVNPRVPTSSGSDYQEVKGKGKKTKKNKMLKVDARILGFSVTAAEDRINVGDIDTA